MNNPKIKCPRCRKPVAWIDNEFRPFCSEKCRLVDLGRWANEEYTIDGGRTDQQESEEPQL